MRQRQPATDPRRSALTRDVHIANDHAAAIGPQRAGDDSDQRGFPCAVRTDQANEIGLLHGEGDAGERLHAAESDGDIIEPKRRSHYDLARTFNSVRRARPASPPGASLITSTNSPP